MRRLALRGPANASGQGEAKRPIATRSVSGYKQIGEPSSGVREQLCGDNHMSIPIRIASLGLLGSLGLALALISQGGQNVTAPVFPSESEDSILRLEVGAASSPIATALMVYASGSALLEYRTGTGASQKVDAGEFSPAALAEVLRIVRDGNLSSYDEIRVDTEQRRLAGGVDLLGSEGETFVVEFALETPGVSSAEAIVRKTIVVTAPETRAQRYPTIPEYRALAELSRLYRREIERRVEPR